MSYHQSAGSGYRQHRAKQRPLLPAGKREKITLRTRGGSRQVVASGGRWERPTLVWSRSKNGREWGLTEYAKYLST